MVKPYFVSYHKLLTQGRIKIFVGPKFDLRSKFFTALFPLIRVL